MAQQVCFVRVPGLTIGCLVYKIFVVAVGAMAAWERTTRRKGWRWTRRIDDLGGVRARLGASISRVSLDCVQWELPE